MGAKKIEVVYSHGIKYSIVWSRSIILNLILWVLPYFFGKYTDTSFPYIAQEDIVQELVGRVGPVKNGLQWCPVVSPHLQVKNSLLSSDVEVLSEEEIVKKNNIQEGGVWKPEECQSRYQVAVIVPFRNRSRNLQEFLSYMHPFLTRQQLNYRIVVVEQTAAAAFNRAKLFNIGFVEALKLDQYDCFIFHDVDLLPLSDYNTYSCTHQPRHMYSAVDTFRYNLPYRTLFGGAVAMQRVHFQKVNGFSNKFYGWGAEDDDMYDRISGVGLTFIRFDPRIATYIMLSHQSSKSELTYHSDNQRQPQDHIGNEASAVHDGLSTLSYQLVDHQTKKLYTWLLVSC